MPRQIGKWVIAIVAPVIAGVIVWIVVESWLTKLNHEPLKAKLERILSETTTLARQTRKVDLDRVVGGRNAFESNVRRSIDVLEPLLRDIENNDQFLESAPANLSRAIPRSIASLQKYRKSPYKYRKHTHEAACNLSIVSIQLSAMERSDNLEVCQPNTYRKRSCLAAFETFLGERFPAKAAHFASLCPVRVVN